LPWRGLALILPHIQQFDGQLTGFGVGRHRTMARQLSDALHTAARIKNLRDNKE
jgi:hypothetical protein